MLIRFIVSNFKSFKDKTVFKPISKKSYKRHPDHVYNTDFDIGLLRASAIYGSNASGKSNLFEAIKTLKTIVTKGSLEYKESIYCPKFKIDPVYLNKPSTFEIEFLQNNHRYFYTIIIDGGRIFEEKLSLVKSPLNVEMIFERNLDENNKIKVKLGRSNRPNQPKEKVKLLIEILTEFLSHTQPFFLEGYNRNIEELVEPFKWFSETLNFIGTNDNDHSLINYIATDKYSYISKNIISSLNLGISDVDTIIIPIDDFFGESDKLKKNEIIEKFLAAPPLGYNFERNGTIYNAFKRKGVDTILIAKLMTQHVSGNINSSDVPFEFNEESLGTQKIFQLIPSIIEAVLGKKVFFIDEIESSIHSVLINELMRIYLDAGSEFCGQLLFTTHECNLLDLDLLRQDEIWFTEKAPEGYTNIYSLSDFKPRFDKDIQKGYLSGQFNTIPFYTEPVNLKWYAEKD